VWRFGSAVAVLAALLGCYNYDPAPAEGPVPGSVVTRTLTDAGALDLGHYLGPEVDAILGRVERINADDLVLSVSSVRNRSGIEHFWKGESVTLPRPDIAHIDERKLAIGRSVFCVVLGVGGAIEVMQAFGVVNTGQETTSGPPAKN
jgi:hypothetical protein